MKLLVMNLIGITLSTTIAMAIAPLAATAAPFSTNDYLSVDVSVRNRARGEKRFTRVVQIVYGDTQLFEKYFGAGGPTPKQRISLKSAKGSITLRGTGNQNVAEVEFNPKAKIGENLLVLLVNGARCQIATQEPEPCQAEVRVIRGRSSISHRIVASGSNGAAYDSGSQDVSSGSLLLDGDA